MKKHLIRTAALALALTLGATAAQAERVLKFASVAPSKSPWGVWAQKVADRIEAESGGALKLQLVFDSQAGDEHTILRQTGRGRLDLAMVSNVPLAIVNEALTLTAAPYLYDSTEQGTCVTHGHLSEAMSPIMAKAGYVPLAWWEVGETIMFLKEPAKVPEDVKGMKVRIAPHQGDLKFAEELGLSGVSLGTSEAVQALQTGNVEGALFVPVFGLSIGVQKTAPYVLVNKYARQTGALVASKRIWDELSEEERGWLGVFGEMAPDLTDTVLNAEQALLDKAAAEGATVYYPTEEEMQLWRAASEGVLEKMVAASGPDAPAVAEAIARAKAACAP